MSADERAPEASEKRRRTHSSTWLHRSRTRLAVLRYELEATTPEPDRLCRYGVRQDELWSGAEDLLHTADCYLRQAEAGRQRFGSWWNGRLYEGTQSCLHAAEVTLVAMSTPLRAWSRADGVLSLAGPLCRQDRRLALVERLKEADAPEDARVPAAVASLLKAAYAVQEERAVRSRNFRNRLIRTGCALTLLLVATVVLAGVRPGAVPVCDPGGSGASGTCLTSGRADAWDVGLVMLLGMLGAAMHVVGRLQKMGGSWNAYNLPFYQELVKLPIGALTAVIGLLLVGTSGLLVVEEPGSWRAVVAYAVVFGLAQMALTRSLDHGAEQLLASDPGPDEAKQLEKLPDVRPAGE
ncbi:hypothetical protein [Streptomyces flavofungini]|uniref:hypothetical protein n=1 Tax=Streptomyces flavofungini TaxID=68200 RepID=UPI0034DF890C